MVRRTEGRRLLDGVDLLLADLDGVIYSGASPIPHAIDAVNAAASIIPVGYVTNNASRTDVAVAEHLTALGLRVAPREVVTSPQAAMDLLRGLVPAGSVILVIGGEGLTHELDKAGFAVTRSAEDRPSAVVQGFSPEVGWTHLAEASFALRSDESMPWVATNTDWTIPVARGVAPGNGTLVSAVHTAVGRLPAVAGKPERAIFDTAVARFGARRPLFLGDRLDTDIVGANRAGMSSALVLTGIDGPKQVLAAGDDSWPTYLLEDLRDLHRPYREVEQRRDRRSGDLLFRCGESRVRLSGSALRVDDEGDRNVELLRAGVAAIRAAAVPIYGLEVAPRLYSWS